MPILASYALKDCKVEDCIPVIAPEIYTEPPDDLKWTVVLLCIGSESYLQTNNPFPESCNVVDITSKDDFTTTSGYRKVSDILRKTKNVVLLVSFPCTRGCLFNAGINANNPKCQDKLKAHWNLFNKLWNNFVKLFV